jgi:hypothetical protein
MDAGGFPHADLFDWGTYQPHGWRTFALTALAFACCVGVSLLLLRYIRRSGRPMLAAVVGAASLIPMAGLAAQSSLTQLTATSPGVELHATAVAVVGVAFLVVIGVSVFATFAPLVGGRELSQRSPEDEGGGATTSAGRRISRRTGGR